MADHRRATPMGRPICLDRSMCRSTVLSNIRIRKNCGNVVWVCLGKKDDPVDEQVKPYIIKCTWYIYEGILHAMGAFCMCKIHTGYGIGYVQGSGLSWYLRLLFGHLYAMVIKMYLMQVMLWHRMAWPSLLTLRPSMRQTLGFSMALVSGVR